MMLVEEYLGIELPDAEGLLPPLDSETVEMPGEDDVDDDSDDIDEPFVLNQRASRRPLQVSLPPRPVSVVGSKPASVAPLARPRAIAARAYGSPAHVEPPDPINIPEPRALRRYVFDDPDEVPEPLLSGASPEPLRLALPANAEEEASLVLAAAAPEDYDDDDWDDDSDELWEDDSEDSFEPSSASLRLTLDHDTMENLRNLEERRSFAEPIWGPSPNAGKFDEDISLFDESDEDDSGIFERDEEIRQANRSLVFDEYDGPSARRDSEAASLDAFSFDEGDDDEGAFPRVAAIRIGMPADDAPEPLFAAAAPEPEVVRWDDDTTDSNLIGRLRTPEADPLKSYSIVPDEEPTTLQAKPLIESDAPRPRRRPAQEEERGSPLIWVAAVTILVTVGGWAGYVLVKDLAWSNPNLAVLTTPEVVGPEDVVPEDVVPEDVVPEDVVPEDVAPTAELAEPTIGIGLPGSSGEDGTLEERLDPTQGRLRVISDRKSRVYINNERMGTTPIESLVLETGVYDVRLVALSTGRSKWVRARVDAGKVIQVELNFQ